MEVNVTEFSNVLSTVMEQHNEIWKKLTRDYDKKTYLARTTYIILSKAIDVA